jgi:hypothetical protein
MSIALKARMLISAAAIALGSAAVAVPLGVSSVAVEADLAVAENRSALERLGAISTAFNFDGNAYPRRKNPPR